jgi:hypothetical protein
MMTRTLSRTKRDSGMNFERGMRKAVGALTVSDGRVFVGLVFRNYFLVDNSRLI